MRPAASTATLRGVAGRAGVAAAAGVLALATGPPPLRAQEGADGFEPVSLERLLSVDHAVRDETPRWSPDGARILFASGFTGGLATIDPEGGHPRSVPVGLGESGHFLASQMPQWSPDGRWVSFVSNKGGTPELWLWSVASGEELQLTRVGGRLVSSYRWAPDGRSIAFSSDPFGDMDLWTVSVPDGRTVRLTSTPHYEVQPAWSPDSESVLFVRLDESWTEHTIVEIPRGGGEERIVLHDTGMFDYHAGERFGSPRVSPDGTRILFRSARSGWLNYWTVPRAGGEPRPVAPDEAEQSHARWSPDGSAIVLVTNRNGTQSLSLVDARDGTRRTLVAPETVGVMDHPEWSPDGRRVSYTLETPTVPRELHVVEVAGGRSRTLVPSLPEGGLGGRLVSPRKVSYPSSGGFTIPAYLYAPPGASAGSSHPGILWIHGGPTSQYRDTYQQHVQYLVQRGYVVLLPNIRGSSGYGTAFEDANNRCWAHCDMEDVEAGVAYLRTLPFVDPDAMGVTGTSYGGIMTMAASAFRPGLFQAAVAQSGYADWERFMEEDNELRHRKLLEYELGSWPEEREVYRRVSSIHAVDSVRTPVLLLHGQGRYPGSPQSRAFAGALQEQYKTFRYKAYPGETYYVASRENRAELLHDMEAYFDFYLKGEAKPLPGVTHVPEGSP